MYQFAFVVEQALGHITHGDNLQRHVPDDPDVTAHWVLPSYETVGIAGRVPVFRSNWTVRSGVRARRGLRRVRRTTSLDAMFFHTQVPAMLSLDLVRRHPTVISIDATPLQYDELGGAYGHARGPEWVERLKHTAAKTAFARARHIVTWSAWARRGLIDSYDVPDDKVTVVPPGVSVTAWQRPAPRRVTDDPVKLLFVGGDLERKGGRLLVEVFRSLRHEQPDLELHLVTRDTIASEPGVVVHHGLTANSPDLTRLYHECDIFALPTVGDCLPMVLSEAGAAGLATVSTSVAAIPEVVLDGATGFVVPPGDGRALADSLRRLIEHPVERIAFGERAVEHVARSYDTATNTRQILTILKDASEATARKRAS